MSKGEKTRQKILADAARLFNQHGFEGSSMSDLMEVTGLEKGGIYRHFASKEELAAEAFDHAWNSVFVTRMHDLDEIPNSVDKLKQFIANFVDRRPSVPGGCPLLNTAIDADDGSLVLRERARRALHQWQGCLCEIITSGLRRKEIRRNVDPQKLAIWIISSLEGALMVSRLEGNRGALVQAKSHLYSYLNNEVRRLWRRRRK